MAQGELPAGAEVILSEFLDRLKRQGYTGDQLVEAGRKWRANFDADMMNRGGFDELEEVALQHGRNRPEASAMMRRALQETIVSGIRTSTEPELDGLDATLAGLEDQETADELRDILGALDDGFTVSEEAVDVPGVEVEAVDIEAAQPELAPAIPAPRLSLSDPLQDEQARIGQEIDALGDGLVLPPEQPVPTYRNEEAAARLAAQQQAAPTETITEAAGETPDGGFWDSVSVQDKLGLGLGLAGTALGMAAPMLERDRKFEGQLGQRAAGDTLARREGALAAGQLARGIRGASLGRRDISPALAMRNAQMASARAGSDVMARAAIASAGERQAAQQQLADIRKARVQTQINAGLGALSSTGAWLSSQGAAQKQDARAKQQLGAAQERNRLQAEQNQLYRDSMQGRGKR
jgi:hypothetical protein